MKVAAPFTPYAWALPLTVGVHRSLRRTDVGVGPMRVMVKDGPTIRDDMGPCWALARGKDWRLEIWPTIWALPLYIGWYANLARFEIKIGPVSLVVAVGPIPIPWR